jgi:hypothetical protein
MTFERWMQEVNELCLGTYAISIYDITGMECEFAFEDGQSPDEFMSELVLATEVGSERQ